MEGVGSSFLKFNFLTVGYIKYGLFGGGTVVWGAPSLALVSTFVVCFYSLRNNILMP